METSALDLTGAMRTLGSTGGNEIPVGVLYPASFGSLPSEENVTAVKRMVVRL